MDNKPVDPILGGHVSTHDWLTVNLRSGLEVQMKMGHVAWESGSRYGGGVSGSWRRGCFLVQAFWTCCREDIGRR